MTQQRRAAAGLTAALAAVMVLGVPLMILLVLDPSSVAACGSSPSGPGPASVPGIPRQLLPIFEGAAQQVGLGDDGWAYLAALNDAESSFGTDNGPGTGVLSGSNSAGAAGPMQIGIGGAATDNWDTIVAQIPAGLVGGTQPPSVYNETDAVYGAAILLRKWGAPGSWPAALVAWNDYPPEIAQVTQLVAQYTDTGRGKGGATAGASTAAMPAGGEGCVPVSGPSTPGAVARVLPNGLAAVPQGAPAAVQEMIAAGNQIIHYPYSYAGGHSPASMKVPPGPDADPGEQENGGPGYDCSSAVSFLLWGGGLGQSLLGDGVDDSWRLETVGLPGAGQWVTIYAGTSGGEGAHVHRGRRHRARHRPRLRDHARRDRPALAARLRGRPRARQRLLCHPTPPRAMTRPCRLAMLACLLSLAGCGGGHRAATPMTSRTSTTSKNAHGGAPIAEHAAVSRFAAAYVRFLDGAASAGRLPDATASVRVLAERAGSIPASRQRGTLLMTRLKPAAGIRDSYLLTARDQAHAVYAQMTLAEHDGRWRVAQLTPPDFLQAFAPAGPPAPLAPSGSAAAERAARRFLRSYLPWLYGQAPRRAIAATASGLLAGLTAHPPRIPPTIRALAPKVAAIAMQRRGHAWQALPNITDGQETYELTLTLTQIHHRWLVSHVSSETR